MTADGNKHPVKVGLVQINNSFSNQNYLPLSVGMLQAYVQSHLKQPDKFEFLLPLYHRMPVEEAVERLLGVDVAFFSTYVWNYRISSEIARVLKDRQPATKIVFGGPHVPDRVERFLRQQPFVDVACHAEGEQTALAILEQGMGGDWEKVPGISYLDQNSRLVQNPLPPRMNNLDSVPSPYLEGVFAPLMEANPAETWIALWETNRGCPFSCTFCDWGSAVQSKVHQFPIERLFKEIEWFAEHQIEFVFCCDANFGILPRDVDIAKYAAETKSKLGYPHALSVQNTKNATERAYATQKILSDAGLNKGVDIALQSTDQNTLKSIKRANISLDTYQELQRRFTIDGVETYTDIILGLPGETYESFADGVSMLIENGQHNRIQFNNLTVLPNAEMGDPEYQAKHGMVTVEQKTINIHGSLAGPEDEIYETQMLVIGTNTLPPEDWLRTRIFSWTAALLHFDKTLQIPFILLHEICSVSYRELVEAFTREAPMSLPVLADIQSLFRRQANEMLVGGPDFTRSEEWLNIWWPTDEYALIELCAENKLGQFYQEAETLLTRLLRDKFLSLPPDLLHQAIELNRGLIKQPFQTEDLDIDLSYNIWEFYRSVLVGGAVPLEKVDCRHHLDRTSTTWSSWDDWCREVIWYGNKKGAYLYGNDAIETQLAGHY